MTAVTTAAEALRPRFNFAEYEACSDIDPDRRLELLDGEIYDMAPENIRHSRLVQAAFLALLDAYGRKRVFNTGTVKIAESGAVEPDVFVLRPGAVSAEDGPWPAAAIGAVVEISVTTTAKDELKIGVYAAAGVDRYWRYDSSTRTLHDYAELDPERSEYLRHRTHEIAGAEELGEALSRLADLA